MKIRKLVGLGLLGAAATVLVYPGVSVGSKLETRDATRYAMLTCYSLHWNGIRQKEIDLSYKYKKDGSISVSNAPCYGTSDEAG